MPAPAIGDGSMAWVAEGVGWLRMPLQGPLGFINVWAIDDDDAWILVDCGLGDAATESAWLRAFAGPLSGRPVRTVLITHGHPDHFGKAGWLVRHTGARLRMTAGEHRGALRAIGDGAAEATRFYVAAGWDQPTIARWLDRLAGFHDLYLPLPPAFERIRADDALAMGGTPWHVIGCVGHSPEHAAFHCADRRVFIAGDQVLPRITASVGVWPGDEEGNPLRTWLDGLDAIEAAVPDDVLVLPSHGDPFHGLHTRVAEMRSGHHAMIARIAAALDRPRRAIDLFDPAFGKPIGPHRIGAATGEVVACLRWLAAEGRATCARDADGVDWWAVTAR
jgi:glyoxylase-like metal-dependent hydrolase (beta-lactamase superfamily II)